MPTARAAPPAGLQSVQVNLSMIPMLDWSSIIISCIAVSMSFVFWHSARRSRAETKEKSKQIYIALETASKYELQVKELNDAVRLRENIIRDLRQEAQESIRQA